MSAHAAYPVQRVRTCGGCNVPSKQKVKTPFGMRTIRRRMKMTRVPGVVGIECVHPRRAPKERRHHVYTPLCKTCRKLARGAPLSKSELAQLDPKAAQEATAA